MDNKPNNFFAEKQTWGTCEELLLACAVHRYGAENWNSVAREVQKRSSTPQHQLLTPFSCQQKYNDLRCRFSHSQIQNYSQDHAPWLDELKRIRVAELKREVERSDLSILSLQLKVKRLTEEREQSLTENRKKGTGISDLERIGEKDSKLLTDKPDTGEESDRENRSVNESNFTDPRGADDEEKQPVEPASDEPQENKLVGEDSYNGSCGSAAKEPARNSRELGESVAESTGGGEERSSKERKSGSDVQSWSTASLSREEADKGQKPEEPYNEEEDQSPANKRVRAASQPLVDCLEILRSHKLGSIFERLDTQQGKGQYWSLIRQHIDLQTVQMRVQANWYSGCNSSFFRDLLLLFNNAILLFGKKSSESMAAIELRQVVLKEMALKTPNPKSLLKEQEQSLVSPTPLNVKSDLESSDSLRIKPNISAPLTACRKRSSISAKGSVSASSSGADKKREQTTPLTDKKPGLDWKRPDNSVKADHEPQVTTKKRARERLVSSTRNNSSKKSRTETNTKPKHVVDYSRQDEVTDDEKSEAKVENERKNKVNVNAKKRSGSNFSSRTKRSSPPKNGPLLGTLKGFMSTSNKGAEKNKKNSKSDSGKYQISRKNSGGKRGKERERNLGRQKRAEAAAPHPQPQVSGKRSNRREGSENASGRARKRSR